MKKLRSPILAVDGIILEKDKVLLIRRNIYPFIGYWVLPGGHVDYGEKVEYAMAREIKEEVGLKRPAIPYGFRCLSLPKS